jgi:hypothetical protein
MTKHPVDEYAHDAAQRYEKESKRRPPEGDGVRSRTSAGGPVRGHDGHAPGSDDQPLRGEVDRRGSDLDAVTRDQSTGPNRRSK